MAYAFWLAYLMGYAFLWLTFPIGMIAFTIALCICLIAWIFIRKAIAEISY